MLLPFGSPCLPSIRFRVEDHHLLAARYPPLTPRIRMTPAPPHTIFTPTPNFLKQNHRRQVVSPHTPFGAPPLAAPARAQGFLSQSPGQAPVAAERQSDKG